MNYIVDYFDKIKNGEIVVCKKVYKQVEKIISILNDKNSKWIFDEQKANEPIEFIETFCKQSKAPFTGQLLQLSLWQKAIINALYGIVDKESGLRKYRKLFLVIARKNGKTTLASGIALYEFIGEGKGSNVYCCANKLDQAKLLYNETCSMVDQSKAIKELVKRQRTNLVTKKELGLFCEFTPLASDSTTLDGLNISAYIMDEIHSMKTNDLSSVLEQGTSARLEPICIEITTNGFIREGFFDTEYEYAKKVLYDEIEDEKLLSFIYEQDDINELADSNTWIKSNPNLGVSKSTAYLESMIKRLKESPEMESTILTKDFNLPVASKEMWLKLDFLKIREQYEKEKILYNSYAIGGVDLSNTLDLTCATLLVVNKDKPNSIYIDQMYFMPEDKYKEKIVLDKVPYDLWVKQGWITLSKGNMVNLGDVTKWFVDASRSLKVIPYWIGYDRWMASYWIDDMQRNGFRNLVPVVQGAKTFSPAMKYAKSKIENGTIIYNNNPVFRWCLSNVVAKKDDGGNECPDKKHSSGRIDGAVSFLDAVVVFLDHKQDYLNLQKVKDSLL